VNYLSNPSFELGDSGLGWSGITDWTGNLSTGGQLVYDVAAHNGTNVMRMNAYAGSSLSLDQRHAITAGQVYEVDGWLKTGTGNAQFKPTNGYVAVLVRFYNAAGSSVAGNMFSERFGASGPTTWTRYSTGPCVAPAGAVTSRVTCYYSGSDATTNGYVYFDDMHSTTGTVARAGALYDPGFETQPNGTWASLPYWQALGNDGGVVTNYRHSGRFALSLYYPETLAAQYWPATPGTRYASGGYIMSPGFTSTNSYGAIIVEYLNSAGTVIGSYLSGHFNPTNPTGSWAWFEASGIAPAGTVTGRTLCALLGPDSTYNGPIYFDDLTQRVVSSTGTVSGLLHNPGFDDGATGNAYDLYVSGGFTNWIWLGGTNGGFVTSTYSYDGPQSLSITYPANMAGQRITAVTGRTYVAEGYISSPTNEKLANDAYGVLLMEFYSTSYQNGTSPVSIVESAHFTSNLTAGAWHHFAVTNHAPWTGAVTCRVVCAVMGNTTGYNGAVYFDGLSVIETNIAIANSQSGALWNPGFEYTANGTVLAGIDNWQNLGFDGTVDATYKRSGSHALKITYPETLLAQYWSATPGYRYSTESYVSTPSGANKFTSSTNAQALLLLQFLDITGTNILATYQSQPFTGTATADTWSNLVASGVAPAGTVSGRTVCALLGYDNAFGGAVWFDDLSQSLVSTGGTPSGVIFNGGFEDGTTGDAFFLSNSLPRWTWYGGSNAGFIVSGVSQSNDQSLTIVYPGNLAGQDFPATTGLLYAAEGYLYTPSTARMTGSTAYATILLEFFDSVGGTGTSVSVVNTIKLTNGSPSNVWIKVGVTNRAPWVGTWVTGRVSCALLGTASNFGGQVYFDSVRVTVSTSALANSQSGALWNPGFEFTADGTKFPYIDSWTNLGEAGGVDGSYVRTGKEALRIYAPETLLAQSWPAVAGYRYSSAGFAYTPASGADRFQSATNTHGVVLLQFLDATGTNILQTFESPYFMTNSATGTWVPLAVTGKAPLGAVSGRTMLAILGTNTGFGGSLWFDDISQSLVSTGGTTQSGVIFNGGFDDGIVGDCYFLSNNLPSWTWYGGSNAGFVVDSLSHSNGQSLTIVYPNNLASQDFVAQTALTYTVEGYLYTPSANQMTGSTAFATILLEFFNSVGGTGSSVSVVNTIKLTNGTPADTWIKVGVTNRAPHVGTWVTGRVSCAYLDVLGGTIGGQVYFDSVRVSVSTVAVANTTNGSIRNPGFEYSPEGTKLPYIDNWTGLGNAGTLDSAYRRTGNNALKIYASETLLAQSWPATPGYRYSSSAYAFTPSETAGADVLVNGALSLVGVAQAPTGWTSFDDGSHEADYWHVLSPTNAWMFYWSGGIYQDVTSGFVAGERYTFGGQFFMEGSNPLRNGTKYGAIEVEFYNAADALISTATAYPMCDSNSVRDAWFESAGSANVPAGTTKMRVIVRCNAPDGNGDGSFTADDIYLKKVPAAAERFVSPYGAHGVVLLQYLNSTGGVMTTYESPYFTSDSTAGSWTSLTAAGVAPVGTVSGRTLVAILGSSTGFSGSLWFDDVSSALVSTGATPAGLIYNGGFDDGIGGDCFFLSNNLPNWTWFGGSNAGFVVSDLAQSNGQSLTIVYPGNLAGQNFPASTGLLYAAEGYVYTPAANRMTGSTAYATILLEFFNSVGGTGESVSVVNTIKLTNGTPADTWIKVSVTNRAPWVGSWVTGRVSCALLGGAENFGGQVYFDSVSVRVMTSALANTQSGTIWNPGFEFSAGGTKFPYIDSWTNLGNAGTLDSAYRRTGNNALKIYASETLLAQSWPATPGYRYSSSAYAFTPSETPGANVLVNGALSLVGPAEAPTSWSSFDDGSHEVDYWHVLSPTNAWMFYWSGGIYQEITTGFVPGERYTFGGQFFMEGSNPLRNGDKYGVIELEFYNATNGLISKATAYPMIASNSVADAWFGSAGSANVPAGTVKMTVVVRCNVPTGGDGSFAADDIYLKKVPAVAERFVSPYGAHGVVLLQYLDATGTNVLQTFESPYFTTNSVTDSWVSMSVTGRAPVGTVSARTLLAVLGSSTGFSGSLWFDDVSQSLVSTGGVTQSGLIYNGGFDDGGVGDCYFLSNSLPSWTWLGGSNAGFVVDNLSQSNSQSLTIVYPDNLAAQTFPAGTGLVYVAEGYMYTPAASRMTGTTAYAQLLLEFFNPMGGATSVSVVGTAKLTNGSPADTWIKVSVTNRAPWVGSWVTGRVSCALLGGASNFGGQVYFDSVRVTVSTSALANSQSGAIWNPGFEFTAEGTKLPFIDNWQNLGFDGNVDATYKRSGARALKITYPETLLAQYWSATPGYRYATEAYVSTPSGADKFTSSTNAQALLLLQYMDITGTNILATYLSKPFTGTATADTWSNLVASGVAPAGTVSGRTVCALLGYDNAFGGAVWFDDVSQSLVSTGSTASGSILNGGFDDGVTGNANYLSNDLPHWVWFGGTNAGFIVDSASHSNGQSLVIVSANNLLSQDFAATTGRSYIVEGYMMTPSSERMTSTTAYATFLLEFFNPQGNPTTSVSVVSTAYLTNGTPADTWIKFSVTNHAPWVGPWVTGRVSCAILDLVGTPYGGVVYFDSVRVAETNIAYVNTQAGALWNPGFEYTAKGTKFPYMDNWTNLGFAGSVESGVAHSGGNALKIYAPETLAAQTWTATAGWKYSTAAFAYTPAADRLQGATNLHAVVLLQFFDATGTNILQTYESNYFMTNATAGTWSNLEAIGVAPRGTVSGRTVLGVLGTNAGFAGSVYFDDVTQRIVQTTSSVSGLIRNPGFDDNAPGNAYTLQQTGDLFNWTWSGGDYAGFVARDRKLDGQQSLVVTYPQNGAYQDFRIASGPTANLLVNPGFEIGAADGGTATGWWNVNEVGQYNWASETGTNGMVFKSWANGNWGFFGQDVSVDLANGSVFTFTIRGLAQTNFSSSGSEAYLKVEFWKSGEGSARYIVTNSTYATLVASPNTWNTYTVVVTNADPDINLVKPIVGYGQATDTTGDQAVKWDNASLVQSPDTSVAQTFVASGYMLTPSTAKFQSDGDQCYGNLVLSFFVDGSTNAATNIVSAKFGTARPADQWIYFAVTGAAPVGVSVTGRITCTIATDLGNPGDDLDLAGVIYFDQLAVTQVGGTELSPWQQWQQDNFGSTAGPNTGLNEDYDGDMYPNWDEFVAGTQPTNAGSLLDLSTQSQGAGSQFVIRWESHAGRWYTLRRATNILSGGFSVVQSGIQAIPPMNTFTDSPPAGIARYYYRVSVTTNQP